MSADTVENKVLNLFKAMKHIVKGFEDEQTFLDSLRVDYSCAGGSCEVWYSYLCSNAIIKDHEMVRYVSTSPLGLLGVVVMPVAMLVLAFNIDGHRYPVINIVGTQLMTIVLHFPLCEVGRKWIVIPSTRY
jgi:hypothetical protein